MQDGGLEGRGRGCIRGPRGWRGGGCISVRVDWLSPPWLFPACWLERVGRGWAGKEWSWDGIEMGRRIRGGWGWTGLGWEEEGSGIGRGWNRDGMH